MGALGVVPQAMRSGWNRAKFMGTALMVSSGSTTETLRTCATRERAVK